MCWAPCPGKLCSPFLKKTLSFLRKGCCISNLTANSPLGLSCCHVMWIDLCLEKGTGRVTGCFTEAASARTALLHKHFLWISSVKYKAFEIFRSRDRLKFILFFNSATDHHTEGPSGPLWSFKNMNKMPPATYFEAIKLLSYTSELLCYCPVWERCSVLQMEGWNNVLFETSVPFKVCLKRVSRNGELFPRVTESLGLGRDLWRLSSPSPCQGRVT